MASSNDIQRLSDDQWKELERRADQFADKLAKGKPIDWNEFINDLTDSMRLAVLSELVKIDLAHRWSRKEKPLIDEYVDRFPELGPLHVVSADLICEEFRSRSKYDRQPERDEYRERFPAQFEAVIREIERELPKAMQSGRTDGSVRAETLASLGSEISKVAASTGKQVSEISTGYHKIEMIGEGHFAEVWRAKAPGGVEIAIKVVRQPIDRDAAQRELSALEIIKDLRHPCLLTTFQFWIQERRLHIAMELADGTLRNRMKTCKKQGQPGIPRDELLMYFADAAEGLDFLHSRKVFHRDIKPDNIMLLQGHAKVADFGLSRMQEKQMATVSFAGTPVYMAPEAWGGKGGPRSDQYSLAFAYAELRQGKRPVEGDDFTTVMSRVLEGEPDFTNIPYEEVKILKRAMSKQPENRFKSCSEFVAAMARATGTPVRTRSPIEVQLEGGSDGNDRTYKEPSSENINLDGKSRKKLYAAVGLLLTLAAIGFGVWQFVIKNDKKSDGVSKSPPVTNPIENEGQSNVPIIVNPVGPAEITVAIAQVVVGTALKVERPFLPAGFDAAPDATIVSVGKRKVYEKIVRKFEGGQALFVLLQPADADYFYCMENKVWNAFFRTFVPDLIQQKKVEAKGDEAWRTDDGNWPTRDLDVDTAHHFAKLLGGQLPTPKQWDHAAGFYDKMGRDGPTRVGTAAVGLEEPRSVNAMPGDVGPKGIRDLAGNGWEYTRAAVKDGKEATVPLSEPDPLKDKVILRGQSYESKQALSYADLETLAKVRKEQGYLEGSIFTTFRVVIELPK